MKKYFVVLAALALVFAGCKPTESGSAYTKISFKQTELTLAIGETQKLIVRWEPTSITTAPECTFVSSDEEVATVDEKGVVTAVASGEANITAKVGDLTAVCQVTVKDVYDMLVWGLMKVGYDYTDATTAIGEPYMVTASNGTQYKVQLFEATFYLCDENITYVNGTGFTGAGFMSFIDAPIEVIIEGDYTGYYWTNELVFEDLATDSAGVVPTGALTDAAAWYAYITDTTRTVSEADGSFKGAAIHYIDWDNNDEVDYLGFIKNGWLGDYSDGMFYQMNITWFDNANGAYGLLMEQNEEGKWQFVQPATFTDRKTTYYELLPEQEMVKKDIRTAKKIDNAVKFVKNIQNAKVFMHE